MWRFGNSVAITRQCSLMHKTALELEHYSSAANKTSSNHQSPHPNTTFNRPGKAPDSHSANSGSSTSRHSSVRPLRKW